MGKEKVIVTGATGSIGSAAVKLLARQGYCVIMACRNIPKANELKDKIINEMPEANLIVMKLDLASRKSIVEFTESIKEQKLKPKKLLNNAGIMCRHFALSEDGIEMTKAVNYFGTMLLTKLMIPLMDENFSIVNTISLSRYVAKVDENFIVYDEKHFSQIGTYGDSKLALMISTLELAKTIPEGCHLNMTDPGVVDSNMIRLHRWFDPLTDILFRPFCNSPDKGAATALKALNSNLNGKIYYGKGIVGE